MRVLVVEDDQTLRQLLEEALVNEGCEVEVAQDGVAAAQRLTHGQYDAVVLDWMLPRVDGEGLLYLLPFMLPRKTFRLVVLTASTHVEFPEGEPFRPDAILYKPFNIDELPLALGLTPAASSPA